MNKKKVTYVEPASYFTEEMLKIAEEYDRKKEAEKKEKEEKENSFIEKVGRCLDE